MNAAADKLSPFVTASAAIHGGVLALVLFAPSLFPARTPVSWGNNSDKGIPVRSVPSLPGIPLPSPPVTQPDAKPNDSSSLHPAEAAIKASIKPEKAEDRIPSKKRDPKKNTEPAASETKSQVSPPSTVAANAVPGNGGQIDLPFGQNGTGSAPAAIFGDGAFGARFPEYVNSLTRAIHFAWQETSRGVPRGTSSRVFIAFVLDRKGKPMNLEVAESSGSVPLDNSAQRAVLAAKIPPLPNAYSGSTIEVRFHFEYAR